MPAGTKFYFEMTVAGSIPFVMLGVGNLSSLFNVILSGSGGSFAVFTSNGHIWNNNVDTAINIGAPTAGDVYCYAIDLSNMTGWIRKNGGNWNNSGTANPSTNTGGQNISWLTPAVYALVASNTSINPIVTINFGASSFAQTIPSGFATWNAGPIGPTGATGPTPILSTWNPLDKSAAVTLSNNNLTAQNTSGASGVRSTNSYTTGKWYFEITYTTAGNNTNTCSGVATAAAGLTTPFFNNVGVRCTTGDIIANASTVATLGAVTVGSVLSFAVDLVNQQMWVRLNGGNWNNSGTANPATNTGGFSISFFTAPVFAWASFGDVLAVQVANFGASAFAFVMPSGFTAWNGVAAGTTGSTGPTGATGATGSAAGAGGVFPYWGAATTWLGTQLLANATQSTTNLTANEIWLLPFVVSASKTFTKLYAQISTLSAGNSIQFGVYASDSNNAPAANLVDSGAVSAGSSGVKQITNTGGLPITLTPGLYFFAITANAAITMTAWTAASIIGLLGNTLSGTTNTPIARLHYAQTFGGALPNLTGVTPSAIQSAAAHPVMGIQP